MKSTLLAQGRGFFPINPKLAKFPILIQINKSIGKIIGKIMKVGTMNGIWRADAPDYPPVAIREWLRRGK